MKKEVHETQQQHNIGLWYATKSQELISGYIQGFTTNTTAQELLEDRAFKAFVRTNIAQDFVWKIFAKRHILAAARNMGLYGRYYDGRLSQFSLEPEDAFVQPDIVGQKVSGNRERIRMSYEFRTLKMDINWTNRKLKGSERAQGNQS